MAVKSSRAKMVVQDLGSEKNLGDEGDDVGRVGEGRSSCACALGEGVDGDESDGEQEKDEE